VCIASRLVCFVIFVAVIDVEIPWFVFTKANSTINLSLYNMRDERSTQISIGALITMKIFNKFMWE
jgi:hypothetical protein